MHIRELARWADEHDELVLTCYGGDPSYRYAVYDTKNGEVETHGEYDACLETLNKMTAEGRRGQITSLDTIVQEMDEEAGEMGCIPDAWEQREWG